jgi:hypothetical protein
VLGTDTSGAAPTATALAANGANCAGNNFALGVDASGAAECAQPAFSNLSGTATDAQVPDILTLNLPSSTLTGITANRMLVGTGTGTGAYNTLPFGGIDGCSAAADKPIYFASTNSWGCGTDGGGGGGMTSFTLGGDAGSNQAISTPMSWSSRAAMAFPHHRQRHRYLTIAQVSPIYISSVVGVDCTEEHRFHTGVATAMTAAAGRRDPLHPRRLRAAVQPPRHQQPGGRDPRQRTSSAKISRQASPSRRRCARGTYPGAACNTSAECWAAAPASAASAAPPPIPARPPPASRRRRPRPTRWSRGPAAASDRQLLLLDLPGRPLPALRRRQ